jgi:uncharacterized SAM-dependent methyltransferase
MIYFKHLDLVTDYHVSLKTVHNWIDAAKQGKLPLQLHEQNGRTYVANTPRNITQLVQLVENGRKYRNSRSAKVVLPRSEFYSIYNEHQIYDIVTNLEIHHEITRQYNYFNGGAESWSTYAARLTSETEPNLANSTIKLLEINKGYLDNLLASYKTVNVVDVGAGNAYPVKNLLSHLLAQGKLGRYVALDISPNMLAIAKKNIKDWFGDKVKIETYERDINYDRFSDLLLDEYTKVSAKDTVNLVMLLGGTLSNMRAPDAGYRVIHDSMGINDLLIHTTKLDTEATRRYFDFDLKPGETNLAAIHGLVVNLLNIHKSYYSVELGYDTVHKQRFERIRLNVALNIKFDFKKGEYVVALNKGDTILTWRGLQQTAADVTDQFGRNDLYLLHSSQTDDREYILTVSRVVID